MRREEAVQSLAAIGRELVIQGSNVEVPSTVRDGVCYCNCCVRARINDMRPLHGFL